MSPIAKSYDGLYTNFPTAFQTSKIVGPLFQRSRPFNDVGDNHKQTDRTAFIVESTSHFDTPARSAIPWSSRSRQNESKQLSQEPEDVDPGYIKALFDDASKHGLHFDSQIDLHVTENPKKSARRREQCRLNQARYRHKQRQKEKRYSESVLELHEEIPLLELHRSRLICGVKLRFSDVVVEYFYLFRYGVSVSHFTLNAKSSQRNIVQCPQTQQQLVFLRSSMAQDIDLGYCYGLDALMNTWRQYSSCFQDIYFQLEQMEEIVTNVVVVLASLNLTLTEATLQFVFPELIGRELGDKLLGRRLKLPCSIWFHWDEGAGLVTRLNTSLDFLLPLSEALNSLPDAAFVLTNGQIKHDGAIEEFDARRQEELC